MFGFGKKPVSKPTISGPTITQPGVGQGATRTFEQRLQDFGPGLSTFLARVWRERASIPLTDAVRGPDRIYDFYSGPSVYRPYNVMELAEFLDETMEIADDYILSPQGIDADQLTSEGVRVHGRDLWRTFYHVLSTDEPDYAIRSRVYVNAASVASSHEIMKVVIGQFGRNTGLWEVKNAGPGCIRLDTIVAYLYSDDSALELVEVLKRTARDHKDWFGTELPPLVTERAPGIGTAGEPPAIELYRRTGARHSFGSFYSLVCWVALKGVPDVGTVKADGRHFLDNILFTLRLLQVDPANPTRFPAIRALETWYRNSVR